jgi:SAM-dependent methyltransferase
VDAQQAFDPEVPSIARTYDYLLGGKDNFPADRQIGDIFFNRFPGAVQIAVDNRACLVRAVSLMAGQYGVDQFIDLGSGLPTASNVHQVAQRVNPATRVAYVDNDPIVLAHGRALLAENEYTTVIQADLRQPEQILGDPEVQDMIDFDRPIGIIASAILHHFLDEENPAEAIREFRDVLPAGSFLFVSHFRTLADAKSRELEAVMLEAFGRGVWRTTKEVAGYFGDMTLLDPGVVECALWRPTAPVDPASLTDWQRLIVAGLGVKPPALLLPVSRESRTG